MGPKEWHPLWTLIRLLLLGPQCLLKYVCPKTFFIFTELSNAWIDATIKRLMKRRQKLYLRARKSNDPDIKNHYKRFRAHVQKVVRDAYWRHVSNIFTFENDPSDPDSNKSGKIKKFWSFVKSLKKDAFGITSLRENGILKTDTKDKADICNRQFQSAFTREDDSDPPPKGASPFSSMGEITVDPKGVAKLLDGLNVHKAPGPDGLNARVLKECSTQISPTCILALIYNESLAQGNVPDDWRHANVSPVFKKGEKYDAANYRPMSLTCICCKTLEHILVSNINKHLALDSILADCQHGFRSRRSCETQLVQFVHDVISNLDGAMNRGHKQTDLIIMDFAKAFDKVPHRRLLHKLDYYGIRGSTHKWISSWLAGRSQQVVLDGQASDPVPVLSGVPQGSVLGPILFLIFINDLPDNIKSSVRLFADDCVLYRNIHSLQDCLILQKDLDSLGLWEADWQMKFNVAKCHSMRVTRHYSHKQIIHDYTLHQQTLENVQSAKYLGITITENMDWGQHISEISSKATKTLGFLQGTWLSHLGVLRRLHTKLWYALNWSMQPPFGALTVKLRFNKWRRYRGRQPAGPAGGGATLVVLEKCSMSCNGQLWRRGGISPLCFSSTRFIVGLCLLIKTST